MENENNNTNTTVSDYRWEEPNKKYDIEGCNITDAAVLADIDYETAIKVIKIYKSENIKTKNKRGKVTNPKATPETENFI